MSLKKEHLGSGQADGEGAFKEVPMKLDNGMMMQWEEQERARRSRKLWPEVCTHSSGAGSIPGNGELQGEVMKMGG